MQLSVSNIAWNTNEDEAISNLFLRYDIRAIDVAPGKYFPKPLDAKDEDVKRVKSFWLDKGINIVGMQSLLFGTSGLNMFADSDIQSKMLNHLDAVSRIGSILGAKKLVFGSPKNRDRSGLQDSEVVDLALNFFQSLGEIARKNGTIFCLEPNPARYGANFMINAQETADIVNLVGHDCIKMQFDTGAMIINNDPCKEFLSNHADLIGHIHLSEPDLAPIGELDSDHLSISRAIKDYLDNDFITIEMVATVDEKHEFSIERSLKYALKNYIKEFV